jgi:hypothetical protein
MRGLLRSNLIGLRDEKKLVRVYRLIYLEPRKCEFETDLLLSQKVGFELEMLDISAFFFR